MPRNTRGERLSSTPKPARYPDISTILKRVPESKGGNGSPTVLPEFKATNVEVWTLDGRQLVGLLETNVRGPFRVQGVLKFDERNKKKDEKYFCKGARNGPFEFEAEITQYAIDADPTPAIWIGTVCGWVRMSPSARYEPYYTPMERTVQLLYGSKDMEDGMEEAETAWSLNNFLLEYALFDGSGLQERPLFGEFKKHARTMFVHMICDPQMRESKLFLWLKSHFNDIHKAVLLEHKAFELKHVSSDSRQHTSLPVRQASPIKKQSRSMPRDDATLMSRPTRQSKSKSATPKPDTPDVMELSIPGLPSHDPSALGTGKNGEALVHPCQVIMDMVLASDPDNERFSVKTVTSALFSDWSLWWSPLSRHLLRLWSTVILDQLPVRYKGSVFYRELQDVARTCNASRRDRELAAAKKRPHVPKSRMGRTVAEIHQITDDEWLAQAAEHDNIYRRKKTAPQPEVGSSSSVALPSKRERGGASNSAGFHGQESTVDNPTDTREGREVQTRAEREAAHAKWLESITSRSREPSPDPYSYTYQKARYNLAHGLDANAPDEDTPASTPAPTNKTRLQVEIYTKKTPHSQKALPTRTPISQHSGKTARMKPKTSSTKRPAEDEDEDFPPILPPGHDHKRSRLENEEDDEEDEDVEMQSATSSLPPSSPSPTDNDEDDIEIQNSDSDSPDAPINPIRPSSIHMARGPNGSMRCIIAQCHFIEFNPNKQEGQDRMREHFEVHEKEDPAVRLARNEGKLNGRAVGFLMEKLREKEIAEGKGSSGNGKDRDGFPLPIVRRRIFGPY